MMHRFCEKDCQRALAVERYVDPIPRVLLLGRDCQENLLAEINDVGGIRQRKSSGAIPTSPTSTTRLRRTDIKKAALIL